MAKFGIFAATMIFLATPSVAQETAAPAASPPVVFKSGTGDGSAVVPAYVTPPRAEIACSTLGSAKQGIENRYYPADAAVGSVAPRSRLDDGLFGKAIASYARYYCSYGRSSGPAVIIVVDFARKSNEPRLYRIDLRDGSGIDDPIRVAHGIGSDPNDDGIIDAFGNVQDSLMSSLGPARGGEIYVGINGRSLRLDGLEPSNSAMRARDIVVHSYSPTTMRYFNAELLSMRSGRPGTSEGCFVVEPDKRDWIMQTLVDGGFLYSGYSGELPRPAAPVPGQSVIFARGTGANAQPGPPPASGTPAGTSGTLPTAPISPAPATPSQ